MQYKTLLDINLKGKIIFLRCDMNVPLDDSGTITDTTRIIKSLPSIRYILNQGAKLIIATHLGRPKNNTLSIKYDVTSIAKIIAHELGINNIPIKNLPIAKNKLFVDGNNIVMLQNVRCNIGETDNNNELAQQYASLCDVFVHDAFAVGHRAETSTDAIANFVPEICAGFLLNDELQALSNVMDTSKKPITAIIAGSKISTKLGIILNLAHKVDYLIVGGGILNTFMMANGINIGNSLYEKDLLSTAREIIQIMQTRNAEILFPIDVVVTNKIDINSSATKKLVTNITKDDIIVDIGDDFIQQLSKIIMSSQVIIWNGPMGIFEYPQFSHGTECIATAIAHSNAYTLAGGGDTIAAINKYHIFDKINYVSTAGGALLEYLAGIELPVLKLLKKVIK